MNSVLQCLAQTPFLLEVLMEIAEPGEKATLNISENDQMVVNYFPSNLSPHCVASKRKLRFLDRRIR